jgi:hypothetical protein
MVFVPDSIGGFQMPLEWDLHGAPEPLVVTLKGSVEPPPLSFSCSEMLFGLVPFSFTVQRPLLVTNGSDVDVHASVSIALDAGKPGCFSAGIENGVLAALSTTPINLSFTPTDVGPYRGKLALCVDGLSDPVAQLPISAECQAPTLALAKPGVDVGECFVGHEYEAIVQLENEADISARYDFVALDSQDAAVSCSCQADPPSGTVNAHGEAKVLLRVKALRLGPVRASASFLAAGRGDLPLTVTVSAVGIGPRIKADKVELAFGKVRLFSEVTRSVTLANESPIPAKLCVSVRGKQADCFRANCSELSIEPRGSAQVQVAALLDLNSAVGAELSCAIEAQCHWCWLSCCLRRQSRGSRYHRFWQHADKVFCFARNRHDEQGPSCRDRPLGHRSQETS